MGAAVRKEVTYTVPEVVGILRAMSEADLIAALEAIRSDRGPETEEPHDKARRLAEELSETLNEAFDGRFGADIQPSRRNGGNAIVGFYNIRSYWFAWRRGRRAQSYLRRLMTMSAEERARHYAKRLERVAGRAA